MSRIVFLLGFLLVSGFSFPQKDTVSLLLVGDMHSLPKIVKGAYKPMVKKVLHYKPDAIFSEHAVAGDTSAMGNWNKGFKQQYLAFKKNYVQPKNIDSLLSIENQHLNKEQFNAIREYYLAVGDRANSSMYWHFSNYGETEKFKAVGNQHTDLTFQLMRKLKLKKIFGMDNHNGYESYAGAIKKAYSTAPDYAKKEYNKDQRKDFKKSRLAVLFGGLGNYYNKPETIENYYRTNSLRYDGFSGEHHSIQMQAWDKRNELMASNIAQLVKQNNFQRPVVIVGAGHVWALQKIFNEHYPEIKLVMYRDLP